MPRKKKVSEEKIKEPQKLNPELETDHPVKMLSAEERERLRVMTTICPWCEQSNMCGQEVCGEMVASSRAWGRY